MKLFDKVKNMFTEEVEEEVRVEQVKPRKSKKNSLEEFEQITEDVKKEEEKKPIFFTDDDFNDMDNYQKKNKYNEKVEVEEKKPIYKEDTLEKFDPTPLPKRTTEPYEEVKIEKKFRPTPIISPVYGILDKNYHKEDIVDKGDTDYQAVDGLSVDSIRNKAYGTLEDELENTLFGNNSILFSDKDSEEETNELSPKQEEAVNNIDHDLDDLENITMDIGKELDSLLGKKQEAEESEDDLFDLIDNMYEGEDSDDN